MPGDSSCWGSTRKWSFPIKRDRLPPLSQFTRKMCIRDRPVLAVLKPRASHFHEEKHRQNHVQHGENYVDVYKRQLEDSDKILLATVKAGITALSRHRTGENVLGIQDVYKRQE